MKVNIIETIQVHPSSPPFKYSHILHLSHIDNDPNLQLTFRYLRVYANFNSVSISKNNPFNVISTALSSALIHYYPLAATLRCRELDSRLELFCTDGQAIPLIHASANCSLESVQFLDDSDPHFVESLVPNPDPVERLVNPCALQVTVFECGGFSLGTAIHHSLCDGLAATLFFNAMAELARGASKISIEPVWDRGRLLSPRQPPQVRDRVIDEFLSLEKGFEPYIQNVEAVVVSECFHVLNECVDRLKAVMFEQCGVRFTVFEALGAFIWRAKVEAIESPHHEKVKFAYSINIRKTVNPPLPEGYWGNGCVAMYVHLTVKELLDQPIWKTAELIRNSKSKATDEYIRSFIDFQELHYGNGITAGKGVTGFTDWRHLGHSSVDFGWGGPVNVLPISKHLLGSVEPCYFLPYSSVNATKSNGFKVLVNLRENVMAAFKEKMRMFSDFLFS